MFSAVSRCFWALPAICLACLTAGPVLSWTTVGNGIEYQEFTVSGPNRVFVARMDRSNTNATIESMMPYGKLSGGTQTVRNQAALLDDSLSYWGQAWGQRNDVVVAVNGDFWNTTTLRPVGGQIHSGWYAKRFWDYGSDSGFFWTLNRYPLIGECVHHQPDKQYITVTATGQTIKFKDINVARGTDQLIIYTPQYDTNTKTDNSGVEVLVEMTRPMLILPSPAMAKGYVKEIRQNAGSTPIPFDHVVLSAHGTAASNLLSKISLGAEIGITQEITSLGVNCNGTLAVDWTKAFASIGGNFTFLRDGVPQPVPNDLGLLNRNPRTAIAYNDNYVFFIVVDGRNPGVSEGMSMAEITNFCITYLQATHGINNDGGGSSTMVVNGVVKNNPSDGWERAVANGIAMVNMAPKLQSTRFTAGQAVVINTPSTNVRLGPGTNYGVLTTLSSGTQGTIVDHSLKGIYAKGFYWWKVAFGSTTGWVAETLLNAASEPPTITQHPSPRTVCAGQTTTFTVSASGPGTLTYQWQKNSVNLSNGGHYSGVNTPTLTVSNVSSDDAANYRCVVSNANGSATSNNAALSLNQTPPGAVSVSDEGAWTPSTNTLKASWTPATDACGQPVDHYEYAVGTSSTSQDVKGWTSTGSQLQVMDSSLNLTEGATYYIQVRAVDKGGLVGSPASSNGITAAPGVAMIGDAWSLPDFTGFSLRNKIVTEALSGSFWLEEQDRSSAVKVLSSVSVERGNTVSVAGVLGISGTHRVMFGDVVENLGGAAARRPVGMSQKYLESAMFNSCTPGVTGGVYLYNIGLLVRCWGKVTHRDESDPNNRFFYIDDGSGLSDGGPFPGVKVRCGSLVPPAGGKVVVNGVVSSEQVNGRIVPIILVRDSADIIGLE